MGQYFRWTPEAEARLRQLSKTMTVKRAAAELGCSYHAAATRLRVPWAGPLPEDDKRIWRMMQLTERIRRCKAQLKQIGMVK